MGESTLRSAYNDQVATDTPMGGGSMEKFDIGGPIPQLQSAQSSVAFEANLDAMGMDIPGGLMTCLSVPEESGGSGLRSSSDTAPISGRK